MNRICPICKRPLVKREGESKNNWERRVSCGGRCGDRMRSRGNMGHAKYIEGPTLPLVEPDFGYGFGGHDIKLRPSPIRLPGPAINRTTGGVSF